MADGKNNHTRKELDTKHDTNTMDDVEFRKWKIKEIYRRTLLPVFDPMWVEHTLGAEAAESLLSELKKNAYTSEGSRCLDSWEFYTNDCL